MNTFPEPSGEQCSQNAFLGQQMDGSLAYAAWYPQMGGYVGKAVVFVSPSNDATCFDVLVWHDGEFPFGGGQNPGGLHHCTAQQFRTFGREVLRMQGRTPLDELELVQLRYRTEALEKHLRAMAGAKSPEDFQAARNAAKAYLQEEP